MNFPTYPAPEGATHWCFMNSLYYRYKEDCIHCWELSLQTFDGWDTSTISNEHWERLLQAKKLVTLAELEEMKAAHTKQLYEQGLAEYNSRNNGANLE